MHEAFFIDPDTSDLARQAINTEGRLRILPASFYEATTAAERIRLCVAHGLYCLPTEELIAHLQHVIAGRPALEIGSGNGVLAQALGIRATDNRMQELPAYETYYRQLGQTPVRYGIHVERLDANMAVERYRPQVVIAAWVTHRYDKSRPAAGGNEMGIDEEQIIANCGTYVLVGNERVHQGKSIWSLPHEIIYPPWIYSRAVNGSRDFIAIWPKPTS